MRLGVWADSAYRSKQNEAFVAAQGFVSHVHRGKPADKQCGSYPPRQSISGPGNWAWF